MIELYNGDCITIMKQLIDKGIKVDAIICDPPYVTTPLKWDKLIPANEMWDCLQQLSKEKKQQNKRLYA